MSDRSPHIAPRPPCCQYVRPSRSRSPVLQRCDLRTSPQPIVIVPPVHECGVEGSCRSVSPARSSSSGRGRSEVRKALSCAHSPSPIPVTRERSCYSRSGSRSRSPIETQVIRTASPSAASGLATIPECSVGSASLASPSNSSRSPSRHSSPARLSPIRAHSRRSWSPQRSVIHEPVIVVRTHPSVTSRHTPSSSIASVAGLRTRSKSRSRSRSPRRGGPMLYFHQSPLVFPHYLIATETYTQRYRVYIDGW